MERLLREVRRRTKVVGAFPDGHSALMLVAARLRHVSATSWGTRKYMNMKLLEQMEKQAIHSAGWSVTETAAKAKMRKNFDTTSRTKRAQALRGLASEPRHVSPAALRERFEV